ncbi:MAG: zinc-dependent metalloprotease [Oligoflexia bacterium]|nr:zinc-dependent metalloprotease [Oligoflexia bacterium]
MRDKILLNDTKFALVIFGLLGILFLASCAKDRAYEEVYKDAEIMQKNAIDTSGVYLYMPSTLAAPREITSAQVFRQGDEKLVKIRFDKNSLDVVQFEKNEEFRSNPVNEVPILSIPATYSDYRCTTDNNGDCLNKEEENNEITWDQKRFFKPDLANLEVKEQNLDFFNLDKSCMQETGSALVDYTITKDVINVMIEKSYKIVASYDCIFGNIVDPDNNKLRMNFDRTSFKARFFYSLVKLDKIISKDYKPIAYSEEDQNKFGFFTTAQEINSKNYDSQRTNVKYFLNRWNPDRKVIEYYMSDSFNNPGNESLKQATYKAVGIVNDGLRKANAGFQLALREPNKIVPGDLRFNTINLVDEPSAEGLLGYGPTTVNPSTGEIVHGNVNIYSGAFKQIVRDTYEGMVDISNDYERELAIAELIKKKQQEEKIASAGGRDSNTEAEEGGGENESDSSSVDAATSGTIASAIGKKLYKRVKAGDKSWSKAREDVINRHNVLGEDKFSILNDKFKLTTYNQKQILKEYEKSKTNELITNSIVNNQNSKERELELSLTPYKRGNEAFSYEEKLLEMSKQRLEPIEMINTARLARMIFPGIKEITGILKANGSLKGWEELTEFQQQAITNIIVPLCYVHTLVHEIGHNLGLRHNFKGSYDKENFYSIEEVTTKDEAKKLNIVSAPTFSSVMDYGESELNTLGVMGKYDIAALRFGYARELLGNNGTVFKIADNKSVSDVDKTIENKINDVIERATPTINEYNRVKKEQKIVELDAEVKKMKLAYGENSLQYKEAKEKFDDAYAILKTVEDRLMVFEKEYDQIQKSKLHTYEYCTDENVGSSIFCDRFDEGTDIIEVAKDYYNRYMDSYRHRYFRNGRFDFSEFTVGQSILNTNRMFYKARAVFDELQRLIELFKDRYGATKEMMYAGCSDEDIAKDKAGLCPFIEEYRQATLITARLFLDVLNTPDLSCAVAEKGKTIVKEIKDLRTIVDLKIRNKLNYTPSSCFDPKVIEYFKSQNLDVLAEGGKYTLSMKEIDPKYVKSSSDISIRGNWQDKLLAMKYLLTRYTGHDVLVKNAPRGSLADFPVVYNELVDYLQHMLGIKKLSNPLPFVNPNSKTIYIESDPIHNVKYSLTGDSYIIPEQIISGVRNYLGLPYATSTLNKQLLQLAYSSGTTEDPGYQDDSDDFAYGFCVRIKSDVGGFSTSINPVVQLPYGKKVYAATKNNVIANILLKKVEIDTKVFDLISQNEKDFSAIYGIRFEGKFTIPTNLISNFSESELKMINEIRPIDIFITALELNKKLKNAPLSEAEAITAFQTSYKEGMSLYQLGEEKLTKMVDTITVATSAPANATKAQIAIYSLSKTTMDRYKSGGMSVAIKNAWQTILMLPACK